MNVCHYCGEPATIHLTDIVQLKKTTRHLCEECARSKQLISTAPEQPLNLQMIVQLLMEHHQRGHEEPTPYACPECGLKYAQFRSEGRLGCPEDYNHFHEALTSLLERLHRATEHRGKVPGEQQIRNERMNYQERLRLAIASEQYEEAARIRDLLRQKDGTDEPR